MFPFKLYHNNVQNILFCALHNALSDVTVYKKNARRSKHFLLIEFPPLDIPFWSNVMVCPCRQEQAFTEHLSKQDFHIDLTDHQQSPLADILHDDLHNR